MAEPLGTLTADEEALLARIAEQIPGGGYLTAEGTSPGDTGIIVRQPEITFARRGIQPFAPTYLGVDDHLRVEITSTIPGAQVTVTARLQVATGEFLLNEQSFTPPPTGAPFTQVIPLREGWLYGLVCRSVGIPLHLAAFIRVGIQRTTGLSGPVQAWWISDVINDAYQPSWPVGRQFGRKEVLGLTDYDVVSVTTADTESLPVAFDQLPRRIDFLARNAPALVRLITVLNESRDQFRVEPLLPLTVLGAFPAFTYQSAVAGSPAALQVVGWW